MKFKPEDFYGAPVTADNWHQHLANVANAKRDEALEYAKELVHLQNEAIKVFQWTLNNIPMCPSQHVRLGDAIAKLHDAGQAWLNLYVKEEGE